MQGVTSDYFSFDWFQPPDKYWYEINHHFQILWLLILVFFVTTGHYFVYPVFFIAYLGKKVYIITVWFYVVSHCIYFLSVFIDFQNLLIFDMDNLQSSHNLPSFKLITTSESSVLSTQPCDKISEEKLRDILRMLVHQMNRMDSSFASMKQSQTN